MVLGLPLTDISYDEEPASSPDLGMKTSRYAASRQKACQQCSSAKAKCDRKPGICTRCEQRGIKCVYPQLAFFKTAPASMDGPKETHSFISSDTSVPSGFNAGLSMGDQTADWKSPLISRHEAEQTPFPRPITSLPQSPGSRLDFSNLGIYCPINADDITARWMNPYIPVPGQSVKKYPTAVTNLICRVLKSYASIATRGRAIVPFIHPTQFSFQPTDSPLASCMSLVRICQNMAPGGEDAAAMVLHDEMKALTDHRDGYDDMSLLGAFQAYLVYMLILFFHLHQSPDARFRQAMMTLQILATLTAKKGLACLADQRHSRPRWEEWIVTEAKCRTLYVMYLFDSVLSSQENLPTFLGTELQGLLAPSDKYRWQAQTRATWEQAYNIHLVEWADGGLTIDELWPMPSELDNVGILKRRDRVNHWLEDVDEYGAMLYAITSSTHGV